MIPTILVDCDVNTLAYWYTVPQTV